jgi:hypothetical protein
MTFSHLPKSVKNENSGLGMPELKVFGEKLKTYQKIQN